VDEAIASIARENGLSPEKLRASVEAEGMPYELYRERIRTEIEHSRVINDMVASKTRVEERELKQLYEEQIEKQPQGGEQFFLRVVVGAGDAPGARDVACGQVDEGGPRRSGEPAGGAELSNPTRAGREGWVHESELAGWMRSPVAALPAGGVSDRIDAGFGCAIVQVVERRAFVALTYEQAREGLHRRVFDERMAVEYKKLVARMREQTYIERKGIFGEDGARRRPPPSSPPSGTREPEQPGEPGF
jgi:peptidyl-prolyl cis-trans isomerase SurA